MRGSPKSKPRKALRYLGFDISRIGTSWWRAHRTTVGPDRVLIDAPTLKNLKKYVRAIHVAVRTGVIRRREKK